ncbi:hypothetical protein IW261DRAFT_402847 [Armillaria novae-zelandiae]|uniref:Secreted protein n=1 Tax=Armillaria novae-zelandiae TaxID=153914 RepID=A0AA39PRI6_9AGAR|nr:hypothetical protein IW261DRAFT_402847 [Armillaria novae-zelandiae]
MHVKALLSACVVCKILVSESGHWLMTESVKSDSDKNQVYVIPRLHHESRQDSQGTHKLAACRAPVHSQASSAKSEVPNRKKVVPRKRATSQLANHLRKTQPEGLGVPSRSSRAQSISTSTIPCHDPPQKQVCIPPGIVPRLRSPRLINVGV